MQLHVTGRTQHPVVTNMQATRLAAAMKAAVVRQTTLYSSCSTLKHAHSRAYAAAASSQPSHDQAEPHAVAKPVSGRPLLTLERAVGSSAGSDAELRSCGRFEAEVFPDLPIATTWGNLLKAMAPRPPAGSTASQRDSSHAEVSTPGTTKVTTVAVNLRSMAEVQRRILTATTSSFTDQPEVHQPAGALLFVSGSHPVRSLPGVSRLLPSSTDAIKLASRLRADGQIPPTTGLWAVANPNLEPDASRLQAKIEAGAQVILTQPPFDRKAFEAWIEDARRRDLMSQARLVVGMPCISSPSNLAFWLSLAGCLGRSAPQQLLSDFQRAASASDKKQLLDYCIGYNKEVFHSMLSIQGVSGLHLMPISPAARRIALQLMLEDL